MNTFVEQLKQKDGFRMLSGVSEGTIKAAEEKLGLRFSEEYKDYLRSCGVAMADGHEFLGLGSSNRLDVVANTLEEREANPGIPANLYVVEQADIDCIVVWQSFSGEVYQSMPGILPVKLCDSLLEYIELEL